MIPDARCEEHGVPLVVSTGVERGAVRYRRYCYPCRRESYRQRQGGLRRGSPLDARCKNGHPKDRFNYGWYGGKKRCIVCTKERGRHKR